MENTDQGSLQGEREGIVTARGTGDGLVIRLDGTVHPFELRESLAEFLSSRKSFLGGNEVALEWVGEAPGQAMIDSLVNFLQADFSIAVKDSRFRSVRRAGVAAADKSCVKDDVSAPSASAIISVRSFKPTGQQSTGQQSTGRQLTERRDGGTQSSQQSSRDAYKRDAYKEADESASSYLTGEIRSKSGEYSWDESPFQAERVAQGKKVSLFDGIEAMSISDNESGAPSRYGSESAGRERGKSVVNPLVWDDPDARIINMTLRSGQKVESDHSIIVRGDVNSGAEVIAGGDIIVLGTLRGIAHAGAFDDTGGGRSIVALSLQPTQLRIGSLISRGKNESNIGDGGQGIEVARIEGNIIVVEPYQVKGMNRKG